jgi:hypothetical protein
VSVLSEPNPGHQYIPHLSFRFFAFTPPTSVRKRAFITPDQGEMTGCEQDAGRLEMVFGAASFAEMPVLGELALDKWGKGVYN